MMAGELTEAGLADLMNMAWTAAKTVSGDVVVPMRTGLTPYPGRLGSVALPLEGDDDEAPWDMRPVVGWARDCDGGGA